MRRFIIILALGALLAAACGAGPTDLARSDGISAQQLEGVWVFSHDPQGGDDALHSGVATIENGCLYVDGAVVVWDADRLDEAESAIASIRDGDSPQLSIGGGGISLDEGSTELPAIIMERCDTALVWFGSP